MGETVDVVHTQPVPSPLHVGGRGAVEPAQHAEGPVGWRPLASAHGDGPGYRRFPQLLPVPRTADPAGPHRGAHFSPEPRGCARRAVREFPLDHDSLVRGDHDRSGRRDRDPSRRGRRCPVEPAVRGVRLRKRVLGSRGRSDRCVLLALRDRAHAWSACARPHDIRGGRPNPGAPDRARVIIRSCARRRGASCRWACR
jgi:hypothetical protein